LLELVQCQQDLFLYVAIIVLVVGANANQPSIWPALRDVIKADAGQQFQAESFGDFIPLNMGLRAVPVGVTLEISQFQSDFVIWSAQR